jgi:gliding motility-associated-like protein
MRLLYRRICQVSAILILLLGLPAEKATAQGPCPHPFYFANIVSAKSSCFNSSGLIIVALNDTSNLTYQWTPSNLGIQGHVADGIPAGVYHLHVFKNNEPGCSVDTTIIVNNANGPAIPNMSITPANCIASNGGASFSSSDYLYKWDIGGGTGPVRNGLHSGSYFVSVTVPGNGCFSIVRVNVPNKNPLEVAASVLQNAKCEKPEGHAQIQVNGGSGSYTYMLGGSSASADLNGLPPGQYVCRIVDNSTQCKDSVPFIISDQPIEGTISLTTHKATCFGSTDGSVDYVIQPGAFFKQPYSFYIADINGQHYPPDKLPAGQYTFNVLDADSCKLPPKPFAIAGPGHIKLSQSVKDLTCFANGSIELLVTGGNGSPFTVDWQDIPGNDNPKVRNELLPGIYKATVYDSLLCPYSAGPYTIQNNCHKKKYTDLIVAQGSSGSFCMPVLYGISPDSVKYDIVNLNSSSGGDPFGAWALQPDGCFDFHAGNILGYRVDMFCIAQIVPNHPGLNDTICVYISVTGAAATMEDVYFAVKANASGTACGHIPANLTQPILVPVGQTVLSGLAGQYGTFSIGQSGCITFLAGSFTGYNVTKICVGAYDTLHNRAHIICYWPTILPAGGCTGNLIGPDSLQVKITDCAALTPICIGVPFDNLNNYALSDNGGPYLNGTIGCQADSVYYYTVSNFPTSGPFHLVDWSVNNQHFSGDFINLAGLVALLNQYDPTPGWSLKNNFYIQGGSLSKKYGPIQIHPNQGSDKLLLVGKRQIYSGSQLRFYQGLHELVFRNVSTGCPDTFRVDIVCKTCGPIHNYQANSAGKIVWNAANCNKDTLFCTTIPANAVNQYVVQDNGIPVVNFESCNSNAAIRLDTGFHKITIHSTVSTCAYDIDFSFICHAIAPADTTLAVTDHSATVKNTSVDIDVLSNDIIFGKPGNAGGLSNVTILGNPLFGTATFDLVSRQVIYTPETGRCGVDSFLYQITDTIGRQSSALIKVVTACDKVFVYNGISPNGDQLNDEWHIIGIEQYPDNEVAVYNRWGNQVFAQKGYTNTKAWSGTWNGRELPDGTYYYVIDLGKGAGLVSGYLQILR